MHPERSRSAFSMIELAVVVGVALTIMGMSAPPVVTAVRKQAVNTAGERILAIHAQAQVLSQTTLPPSDRSHYGVVLVQDPGQPAYAVLVKSLPSNGPFRDKVLLSDRGLPVARLELSPGLRIHVGDQPLDQTPTREIAWFYQYRTGVPVAFSAGGPSRHGVNIGGLDQAAGSATNPLFGLTIHGSPYTLSATAIAPDEGSEPGLSLRIGPHRKSVTIASTGIAHVGDF